LVREERGKVVVWGVWGEGRGLADARMCVPRDAREKSLLALGEKVSLRKRSILLLSVSLLSIYVK
jgi:hypothetical protein